jgi:protein CWC15
VKRVDEVDDDESRRRKLIEEMKRLDEDGDSESDSDEARSKGKAAADGDSSDSSSDDDDDEEDDTAALLRELEKIKRERAEERARQEKERSEIEQSDREDEIALGNPLLNLENAMKGGGAATRSNGAASFGVKRRWDDDVIFKNQAMNNDNDKGGFVNDLTRECKKSRIVCAESDFMLALRVRVSQAIPAALYPIIIIAHTVADGTAIETRCYSIEGESLDSKG